MPIVAMTLPGYMLPGNWRPILERGCWKLPAKGLL